MGNHILLEQFNKIYRQTYQNTFKYIVLHCNDLENVSDLLQDIYKVGIEIDDYININSDTFDFGYAVYDENNNIYQVYDRYDYGTGLTEIYERKLYTELQF